MRDAEVWIIGPSRSTRLRWLRMGMWEPARKANIRAGASLYRVTTSFHCGRKRYPGSIRGHCRNHSTTWLSFWVTDQACFRFKASNHNSRPHNVLATIGQITPSPITQPADHTERVSNHANTGRKMGTYKYKGLISVAVVTQKPQVPRQHVYRVAVGPD